MGNIYNSSTYYDLLTVFAQQSQLPAIRGQWFFVDPYAGSDTTGDGQQIATAFASLSTAYAACTDGAGDGIVLLSYVAVGSTSANTTSYLEAPLTWLKSGITVVGVNSQNGIFGRSRIASKDVTSSPTVATLSFTTTVATRSDSGSFITDGWAIGQTGIVSSTGGTSSNNGVTFTVTGVTAKTLSASAAPFTTDATPTGETAILYSTMANLITLSGSNNSFINITFWNSNAQASSIGGVIVTGVRNRFFNCHIGGGMGCTAVATTRSLELGSGADENLFRNCVIGSDTVDRGNNANCELYLNGTAANGRNAFESTEFLSYTSTGTAHGAIKSAAATAMGRNSYFKDCLFENYTPNLGADQTSMFIGTGLNTAKIIIYGGSILCGYALADSSTTNKCVFVGLGSPTSNGAGGIATTKSS